jgi:hypothetical protein
MTSILCIGIVIALVVFVIVLNPRVTAPKKAQKGERAAIMKQLLTLSERENSASAIAPSRSRMPHVFAGTQAEFPRKPAAGLPLRFAPTRDAVDARLGSR